MYTMISKITEPIQENELKKILTPSVKKWFFNKFPSFALPQKFGVMPIHCRENVLISSPTGSGKTLTAFLSILNELVDSAEKGILEDKVYAIYISPLKALGYDIEVNLLKPLQEIEELIGKPLGIRVGVRTGDTSQYERQKMLKNPPHILITTPESIALMLASPKFKDKLTQVDWVIIDEIHAMAENKRGVHLSLMLEHLQYHNPGMTRVGLSATVSPLEDVAKYLAGSERDCKIVDISYLKELDIKVISPVNDLINTDYKVIQDTLYSKLHELIQSHKTTLIFTNTRAATERVVHTLKQKFPKDYYEMQEKPPFEHASLIGAHHGSLSKDHRFDIEQKLRDGKLKCGVCSTSLELGIDIGSIDLVILLGSPKSVARALQRIGRAGHQLHSITKGRVIVLDRDDLVECSTLVKNALEHNIDAIHIPQHSYDILVQHILGFVLGETISIQELYEITKRSYCYENLKYEDFYEVVRYLAGDFPSLENRNIFAKIFMNEDGTIARRGKMTRVIYASNLGTIPSSSGVIVKTGDFPVGSIDEGFLERLKKGDRFVLGGDVYEFKFARGMVAQVTAAYGKSPTIPRWFSETLPLSFDLAKSIQHLRSNVFDMLVEKKPKGKIIKWLHDYLYVDEIAAEAIFNYMEEQFLISKQKKNIYFPKNDNFIVERYVDEMFDNHSFGHTKKHYLIFHSLHGRKANEALSRVFAFALGKYHHQDIEIGLNDNGFYLASTKDLDPLKIISLIEEKEFRLLLKTSIDNTEVLRRRFRQCAERALMILRNYKGRVKNTGKQQVSSMILLKAAKRIGDDFIILRETYREVMEDVMDIEHAEQVFKNIKNGSQKMMINNVSIPSPFATNLILQGYSDIISIHDRHAFLQNMHKMVLAKISSSKDVDYEKKVSLSNRLRNIVDLPEKKQKMTLSSEQKELLKELRSVKGIPRAAKGEIALMIRGDEPDAYIINEIKERKELIKEKWPKKLSNKIFEIIAMIEKGEDIKSANDPISYEELWDKEAEEKEEKEKDKQFLLKKDLALAFKKRKTPYDVIEQIFESLDKEEKPLKKKALDYLQDELKGTIHKVWSDRSVKYLLNKVEISK